MFCPDNRVLVVIPAYNEAGRIGKVVHSVQHALPSVNVLVVNDCSTDFTEQEAREAGATVLSHPVNLGYGASLETGYLYASLHDFDIVCQMDGDGQHLAEEIPSVLSLVMDGKTDIALGSRYISGKSSYRTPLVRRMGQRFFARIFSLITKQKVTDPTSGFQCLNRKVFEWYAEGHFPRDFPDIDVLIAAHFAGFRLMEAPVSMKEREGGTSIHSGLRPFYYFFKMILSVFIVLLNRRRWNTHVS
ncbi:MAG: glycosyltransferase family 2 protein [Candidatus Latescibacter sp.]|nr:glycosyltransferase family 2 protein [Candidatus Latescibacter sp.]